MILSGVQGVITLAAARNSSEMTVIKDGSIKQIDAFTDGGSEDNNAPYCEIDCQTTDRNQSGLIYQKTHTY